MPRTTLDESQLAEVIARCEVVRVAFQCAGAPYLIPFGYVWMDSTLCGVTDPGRKTELAAANPEVAFQVDTSPTSGLFAWESVTGVGRFDVVDEPVERERIFASLREFLVPAPEWWREEQLARLASGRLLAWRLTLGSLTGERYAPEAAE